MLHARNAELAVQFAEASKPQKDEGEHLGRAQRSPRLTASLVTEQCSQLLRQQCTVPSVPSDPNEQPINSAGLPCRRAHPRTAARGAHDS